MQGTRRCVGKLCRELHTLAAPVVPLLPPLVKPVERQKMFNSALRNLRQGII